MDDLISREAAIKAIGDNFFTVCEDAVTCMEAIKKLPSAEKIGKWIMKPDPYGFFDEIPVCSVCGCTTKYRDIHNYCPNCGAKMEE